MVIKVYCRKAVTTRERVVPMSSSDIIYPGGLTGSVAPGTRVNASTINSSIHKLTYPQFRSTKPEFAGLDDDMTHFFITGKESLDEARTNHISAIIAGTINCYYDGIGMYPFVPQLRERLERSLTKQEKLRTCTTPDERILQRLWTPVTHPPMFPAPSSSGTLEAATHMLADILQMARNDPHTANEKNANFRQQGIFQFEDLPGEIRNTVYRNLVIPNRHFRELTGHVSDFYETQTLLLNHKIKTEASAIWWATPLRICIEEADVAFYDPRLHKLSSRLRCRSLTINLSLADRSKLVRIGSPMTDMRMAPFPIRDEFLMGMLHRLCFQISKISVLENLKLESKRLLCFKEGRPSQGLRKLFPDIYFDCFKQFIKGLRKVEIEGDLNQKSCRSLEVAMTSQRSRVTPVFTEADLFQIIKQHQCACMRLASEGHDVWWLKQK